MRKCWCLLVFITFCHGQSFTNISGDINKVIENVKFQMELVAQNNHLSVQFAQDGGETPSGIALKIRDLESFEDYQDDLALWTQYEHEIYQIERNIASGA